MSKKKEVRRGCPYRHVRLVCFSEEPCPEGVRMVWGFANDILDQDYSGVSAPMLVYRLESGQFSHDLLYTKASYDRFCKSFDRSGDFPVLLGNVRDCGEQGLRVLARGLFKEYRPFSAAQHLFHTEEIKERRRNRTAEEALRERM